MDAAAFKDNSLYFAVGFAIFEPGEKLAAGCHKINPLGSILAAGIIAIRDGIKFWQDKNLGPIRRD